MRTAVALLIFGAVVVAIARANKTDDLGRTIIRIESLNDESSGTVPKIFLKPKSQYQPALQYPHYPPPHSPPSNYPSYSIALPPQQKCRCPPGPPGPPGYPGRPGVDGLDGVRGDKGEPGEPGAYGKYGEKGDTGNRGPKGSRGKKGSKGDSGTKGDQGSEGLHGPPGSNGVPGTPGTTGAPGPNGRPGPKGPPGAPGYLVPSRPYYYPAPVYPPTPAPTTAAPTTPAPPTHSPYPEYPSYPPHGGGHGHGHGHGQGHGHGHGHSHGHGSYAYPNDYYPPHSGHSAKVQNTDMAPEDDDIVVIDSYSANDEKLPTNNADENSIADISPDTPDLVKPIRNTPTHQQLPDDKDETIGDSDKEPIPDYDEHYTQQEELALSDDSVQVVQKFELDDWERSAHTHVTNNQRHYSIRNPFVGYLLYPHSSK